MFNRRRLPQPLRSCPTIRRDRKRAGRGDRKRDSSSSARLAPAVTAPESRARIATRLRVGAAIRKASQERAGQVRQVGARVGQEVVFERGRVGRGFRAKSGSDREKNLSRSADLVRRCALRGVGCVCALEARESGTKGPFFYTEVPRLQSPRDPHGSVPRDRRAPWNHQRRARGRGSQSRSASYYRSRWPGERIRSPPESGTQRIAVVRIQTSAAPPLITARPQSVPTRSPKGAVRADPSIHLENSRGKIGLCAKEVGRPRTMMPLKQRGSGKPHSAKARITRP